MIPHMSYLTSKHLEKINFYKFKGGSGIMKQPPKMKHHTDINVQSQIWRAQLNFIFLLTENKRNVKNCVTYCFLLQPMYCSVLRNNKTWHIVYYNIAQYIFNWKFLNLLLTTILQWGLFSKALTEKLKLFMGLNEFLLYT